MLHMTLKLFLYVEELRSGKAAAQKASSFFKIAITPSVPKSQKRDRLCEIRAQCKKHGALTLR